MSIRIELPTHVHGDAPRRELFPALIGSDSGRIPSPLVLLDVAATPIQP